MDKLASWAILKQRGFSTPYPCCCGQFCVGFKAYPHDIHLTNGQTFYFTLIRRQQSKNET